MNIKLLLLIAVFFLSSCTYVNKNISTWSAKNTGLQTGYIMLTAIDVVQTVNTAQKDWRDGNDCYRERNPILGSYPHQDKVYLFAITGVILETLFVVLFVPDKYRTYFQSSMIAVETVVVVNNERIQN